MPQHAEPRREDRPRHTFTDTADSQGVQSFKPGAREWIARIDEPAVLCRHGRVIAASEAMLDLMGCSSAAFLVGRRPETLLLPATPSLPFRLRTADAAVPVCVQTVDLSLHDASGQLWIFSTSVEDARDEALHAAPDMDLDPARSPVHRARDHIESFAEDLWELPRSTTLEAADVLDRIQGALVAFEDDLDDAADLSELLARAMHDLDPTRFRLSTEPEGLLVRSGEQAGALVYLLLAAALCDEGAVLRLSPTSDATDTPTLVIERADEHERVLDSARLYRFRTLAQGLGGSLVEVMGGRMLRLRLPAAGR
jgi:PAS domain-containing protein